MKGKSGVSRKVKLAQKGWEMWGGGESEGLPDVFSSTQSIQRIMTGTESPEQPGRKGKDQP